MPEEKEIILSRLIQEKFNREEKFSNRLARAIVEMTLVSGWDEIAILDFLLHGAEKEFGELDESFDWILFKKKILKKLRP
ncbi:MAG: hypothetical protein H7A24_08970 [Leptospiraceae bacterium]|nr:hypothetical protein [Leptospiraceae bacterium]MCP5512000.1 hypothetical protein [Leptospiraceae bacterium]